MSVLEIVELGETIVIKVILLGKILYEINVILKFWARKFVDWIDLSTRKVCLNIK